MSWKTEVQKVLFDATQGISNATSGVSNWWGSLINNAQAQVGSFFNGSSVIGINANEIDNMRNAIREYVSALEAHLNQVVIDADTSQAFKGEYSAAIKEYVAAIVQACKCITSNLLAFSDQLKEVKEAYQAQDTEMAGKIRQTSSATEGQFTKYEEKY